MPVMEQVQKGSKAVGELLRRHFGELKDPRVERTKEHSLLTVLAVALCGALSGATGWDAMAEWGRDRAHWLSTFVDVSRGTPSADTIRRLFERFNPRRFADHLAGWVQDIRLALEAAGEKVVAGQVIGFDGKTRKGARGKKGRESALHLLHAWAGKHNLLLGQRAVNGAPGEVAGVLELLETLDIKGAIVTLDANGCTQEIGKAVQKAGGNIVVQVKGNRGKLHQFMKELLEPIRAGQKPEQRKHHEEERAHGREEERTVWAVESRDWPGKWAFLKTAVLVRRVRIVEGKQSVAWHYYATDLPPHHHKVARVIREHWNVENGLHWTLDVCFGEDDSRVRDQTSAQNLATVTRLALVLLRQETSFKGGLPLKLQKCNRSTDYLTRVICLNS